MTLDGATQSFQFTFHMGITSKASILTNSMCIQVLEDRHVIYEACHQGTLSNSLTVQQPTPYFAVHWLWTFIWGLSLTLSHIKT